MGGGGWSWVEVEMSWVEMDGAGWSWVEVGARFSNTQLEGLFYVGIFVNYFLQSLSNESTFA